MGSESMRLALLPFSGSAAMEGGDRAMGHGLWKILSVFRLRWPWVINLIHGGGTESICTSVFGVGISRLNRADILSSTVVLERQL